MEMSLLLQLVLTISGTAVLANHIWDFEGTTDGSYGMEKNITLTVADEGNAVFSLDGNCAGNKSYIQIKLYDASSLKTIIYKDMVCGTEIKSYSEPHPVKASKKYKLQAFGKKGISFTLKLVLEETDIEIEDMEGTMNGTIRYDTMLVKTFTIKPDDIKSTSRWSYIQVAVESDDDYKYLNPDKTGAMDERLVARLMVTNDSANLEDFHHNPTAVLNGALRLSFSTFGMITLSSASKPKMRDGIWFIGVVMDRRNGPETREKKIKIDVTIQNDYEFSHKIWILFAVSWIGILIPVLARFIFDQENIKYRDLKLCRLFEHWVETIKNWFWSGRKGLTYLTFFLACLLIVSAFQVVHAKYIDMQNSGNRDICFYNERCYRPYGDHYDVSVNGIASNLPFMVHGLILVIYFSISEAYCRSNKHKYFDYSIPYSFGLAFICEGFGSLLYHICPSQIIFQFDTLFMFVISILMIIAIFEGYSIREVDKRIRITSIARHKALRPPKVFAFFVGPVYFFNFVGNLIATEGLPKDLEIAFYTILAIWWIFILLWAAYKLGLLPDSLSPVNLPELEELKNRPSKAERHKSFMIIVKRNPNATKCVKRIAFLLYCSVVAAGLVMACLEKLAFSIFILGVLILAVVILTMVFFIPTIWTVLKGFEIEFDQDQPINNTCCCNVSKQCLILIGVVAYLLTGCAVVVISLVFFTVYSTTDKSLDPWKSRERNSPCFLNHFYDTHDFWHLFASFALTMMTMVVVQICKPCRDCYLSYKEKKNKYELTVNQDTETGNTDEIMTKTTQMSFTDETSNHVQRGNPIIES